MEEAARARALAQSRKKPSSLVSVGQLIMTGEESPCQASSRLLVCNWDKNTALMPTVEQVSIK